MEIELLHIIKGGLLVCSSGQSSLVEDIFLARKGFPSQTAIQNAQESGTAGKSIVTTLGHSATFNSGFIQIFDCKINDFL